MSMILCGRYCNLRFMDEKTESLRDLTNSTVHEMLNPGI